MMRIRNTLISTLALGAMVAAAPASIAAAPHPAISASQDSIDQEELSQITERFDFYDVPEEQRQKLLDKLYVEGELWDSMNGSEPVAIETRQVDGATETIQRFADGSIVSTGVPVAAPTGGISPQSISGCTASGVGGGSTVYRGCKVHVTAIIVNAHFFADWTSTTGVAKGARIDAVRPGQISVVPGTFTPSQPTIAKRNWDPTAPARARLSFTVSLPAEAGMYSAWLEAYVYPTRHSSDSNFNDIVE